jgi:NAD(P)H dehydrogenase (quinone)
VAPADGPVSWTTHADLAEAAAIILADQEGRFDGATPPLTGPDALDLKDIAGILSELTGRAIHRVVADDDEWTAGLIGQGVPEAQTKMLLGMFHASRRGEFAMPDSPNPTSQTFWRRRRGSSICEVTTTSAKS